MSHIETPPGTVAERLRQALDDSNLSQRALARTLAGPAATPKQVENVRRQLSKWTSGATAPSPPNARRLALGKPADYFTPERARRDADGALGSALERLEALQVHLAETQDQQRQTAELQQETALALQQLARRLQRLLGNEERRADGGSTEGEAP